MRPAVGRVLYSLPRSRPLESLAAFVLAARSTRQRDSKHANVDRHLDDSSARPTAAAQAVVSALSRPPPLLRRLLLVHPEKRRRLDLHSRFAGPRRRASGAWRNSGLPDRLRA